MKQYVNYMHCPDCDIQVEIRGPKPFYSSMRMVCPECNATLRGDTAEFWRPYIIIATEVTP